MGIDPGAANLGYGIVRFDGQKMTALDGGVITTSAQETIERRLGRVHGAVGSVLDEFRPDALALEEVYFGRNVRSAMSVGQASGVAMLAAFQRGVACYAYTPQAIKMAVCGNGAAGKEQVQRMVGRLLRLPAPPEPDHAADALAVAICHAGTFSVRAAVPAGGAVN